MRRTSCTAGMAAGSSRGSSRQWGRLQVAYRSIVPVGHGARSEMEHAGNLERDKTYSGGDGRHEREQQDE